jgi:uncharacterized OB-fold protein
MAAIPPEPLEIRAFPGTGDPALLLPARTRQNAPFFDALTEGVLRVQGCDACARTRWPIAPVCPYCRGRAFAWRALSGAGTVHSWVGYRRAYLPEFEALMPYDVLCVSLESGPRIFGRLAGGGGPSFGMAVQAIVERFPGGECVPAFVAATD